MVAEIPDQAVQKKGSLLNRYYILRKGDTPRSVSELIYGDKSHAKNLVRWASGTSWKVGSVIYYSSPVQADDSNMSSFYAEKNIQPETYTIQKGDTLSKLALHKYGNKKSWKEIAIVNSLHSNKTPAEGETLKMYPAVLTNTSTAMATTGTAAEGDLKKGEVTSSAQDNGVQGAENPSQSNTGPSQEVTKAVAKNNMLPMATPPSQGLKPGDETHLPANGSPLSPGLSSTHMNGMNEPSNHIAGANTALPAEPKTLGGAEVKPANALGSDLDWGKLINQNMMSIGVAGLIALLGVSLMVVSKRKKAKVYDFSDEEVQSGEGKMKNG